MCGIVCAMKALCADNEETVVYITATSLAVIVLVCVVVLAYCFVAAASSRSLVVNSNGIIEHFVVI
jgi:hypothetical protein